MFQILSSNKKLAYDNFQILRWLCNAILSEGRFQKESKCPMCRKHNSGVAHISKCELVCELLCEHFHDIQDLFKLGEGWLSGCLIALSFEHASKLDKVRIGRAIATATITIHDSTHSCPRSDEQARKIFKAYLK